MSAWPLLDIPVGLDDAALVEHFWDVVTDEAYVVVLDRQDDGLLRFRTAFPADASYLTKIRSEGSRVELHKPPEEKEMPQS